MAGTDRDVRVLDVTPPPLLCERDPVDCGHGGQWASAVSVQQAKTNLDGTLAFEYAIVVLRLELLGDAVLPVDDGAEDVKQEDVDVCEWVCHRSTLRSS